MAIEVYNSSISNQLWYTDKCRISTTGTAVTYQVYATALGTATAEGNIYSANESVGANETKYIYVGVGNYLTITGSGFTAVAIGTATSAQAGTGNFTEQFIAPPAPVVTSGSAEFVNAFPSGQYLSTLVSAPVTDSTTYEWWARRTSNTPTTQGMLQTRTSTTGGDGIDVSITSGQIQVSSASGFLMTAGSVSLNTWYHIAVVRNGTTNWRVYLNGTDIGGFAFAGTTGTQLSLGRKSASGFNEFFGGYISNFRYVKGTAVYTGAFTPPTAPLTDTQSSGTNISAITGTQTQLLLNTVSGANFLVDSSSYTRTVTNNNSVTSSALNPF
jgi:hypothetical protein